MIHLLALAALTVVPPPDATQAFTEWAEAQGAAVSAPACHVAADTGIVTCYGRADGSIVVAEAALDDEGNVTSFLTVSLTPPTTDPGPTVPSTVPAATTMPAAPGTSFGPGSQIVGQDVQPGSYSATANDLCYWERLSGFGGDSGDIIANGIAESGQRVIVEIAATDVGFSSSGCGPWMLLP